MKPAFTSRLLALFALGLLGVCLTACGSSSKDTSSTSQNSSTTDAAVNNATTTAPSDTAPAPPDTKVDSDKDNDVGAPDDDKNNNSSLDFGHEASASVKRPITALIKRYYATAAAENGARACSMLYSTLAEAVPEDYGLSPPGEPYMRGTTCPAVMTLMFKHFHPQLELELPKLKVTHVRLIEHHGLVFLHFGALPERVVRRCSIARSCGRAIS